MTRLLLANTCIMALLRHEQRKKISRRDQASLDKVFSNIMLHLALATDQDYPLAVADKTETLCAGCKTLIA